MCGFAGFLGFGSASGKGPPNRELLAEMADRIAHRGPDDAGIFTSGRLGIAHRRLSIIDAATGAQPMCSADKRHAIVYNGEIFNYIELRRDLQRRGVRFRTASDTEVVLELYRTFGLDGIGMLNGQFAFAIWDADENALHLVRDRVGICPLFYTVQPDGIVFASEVKALLPALPQAPSLSADALDECFTFWAPLSPGTIFDGIERVSPGEILTVSDDRVTARRYWQWPVPDGDYAPGPVDELAGELHDLLVDATRIRLRADVPVAAYLSGGLDSSAIASLVLNHTDNALRTFSLSFADRDFDESRYQRMLVDHARVNHGTLRVTQDDIVARLAQTVWHAESPILRTAPVPMGLLSGFVRDFGYKVVLTGEGADEVLGGYDIFKEMKARLFWARRPDSRCRPMLLRRLYPYLELPRGQGADYLKAFFGGGLDDPGGPVFSHLPRWTSTARARRFFSNDLLAQTSRPAIDRYVESLPARVLATDPFNRAQYIEATTLMNDFLLSSQGDRMLMMNSVEGRFPFLDHRVIEFAATVPPAVKMKVLNEKYLLKKAVGRYLPPGIVARHKQPYRAPGIRFDAIVAGESPVAEFLSERAIRDAGYFDAGKVAHLRRKAAAGRRLTTSESQALTGILTTQILHDQFSRRGTSHYEYDRHAQGHAA